MFEKVKIAPKVLIITNQRTTGPLWTMSFKSHQQIDVALEPDPEKVLERWEAEIPDMIIFDVNFPDAALFELIRKLRFETSVPILLLTSYRLEEILIQAYDAGVDECILKPIGPALFHAKVKVWMRRATSMPAEALEPFKVGNIQLFPAERTVVLDNGEQVRLTNLELRLLYCLMNQPGHTVANDWLIQRVWGINNETPGGSAALKNVVYRLRIKVEKNPASPKLIETVANLGYRFASPGG